VSRVEFVRSAPRLFQFLDAVPEQGSFTLVAIDEGAHLGELAGRGFVSPFDARFEGSQLALEFLFGQRCGQCLENGPALGAQSREFPLDDGLRLGDPASQLSDPLLTLGSLPGRRDLPFQLGELTFAKASHLGGSRRALVELLEDGFQCSGSGDAELTQSCPQRFLRGPDLGQLPGHAPVQVGSRSLRGFGPVRGLAGALQHLVDAVEIGK
jgi:hypothetical protein